MAGGGPVASTTTNRASQYGYARGGLNWYIFIVALTAGSGGLLFGYDIGVTGGVTSMPEFLQKFFPSIYDRTQQPSDSKDPYCTYDDQKLQLFTSSFFLAGMFVSFFAGSVVRRWGRKPTMLIASVLFLAGAGLNAGAQDLAMLVIGRVLLGFGVGCGNNAVPLYLSECAPPKYRGGLNMMFQLAVTIGIIVAQLVNYGTQTMNNGWRLSLGLAGVPAIILLIGSLLLPETPNSLIERGHRARGRAVLARLRRTEAVDTEFEDICAAAEESTRYTLRQSWAALFSRQYSPMLIVTSLIAMLQQLTGINAIMFYVPVLFSSFGTARHAALLNTVIIGAVNVAATFVSIFSVDKFGRRGLFLEGGIQMFIGQVVTAAVLGVELNKYGTNLPSSTAAGVLVVICVYVAAFAWSWGPLGWLVPSEIQTLETRGAGMSMAVIVNFLFSFVIGQAFLSMMCAMRWGVFLFFAGWVVIMTFFVYFCLPETKGVPVETVPTMFARHWLWGRVMGEKGRALVAADEARKAGTVAFKVESGSEDGKPASDQ
ncbi:hypothetical protein N2152v2_008220 [Parachlorella kessleri]